MMSRIQSSSISLLSLPKKQHDFKVSFAHEKSRCNNSRVHGLSALHPNGKRAGFY